jgi:hypothetical protein
MYFLAFDIISKEIEFIKKQMIVLIQDLDKHKHMDAGTIDLNVEKIKKNLIRRRIREDKNRKFQG